MSQLKIVEWPAKVLETRAAEVSVFDAELARFVEAMHATMDEAGGIGLAANQVNVLQRVLTIHIPFQDKPYEDEETGEECPADEGEPAWWHNQRLTFINPVITKRAGKTRYMEGCLSFPEVYDYVDRLEAISVKAQDASGAFFEVEATGLLAICLQHEIDHLDGIVFINRMSRLKSQMIRKKIQKRQLLKAQAEV